MHSSNLRVPFQQCRRRGAGRRLFLPLKLHVVEYLLRFTDGAQERYQVAYTASIQIEISQQGWRYRGHVSRQLSIYNRAGERFEKADVDRRIELLPAVRDNAVFDRQGWQEGALGSEPFLPEDEFETMIDWLTMASVASLTAEKRHLETHFRRIYNNVESISQID